VYSAKKIKTKLVDEYSILKPETSSDSPSEKSNGVRFLSASIVVIQRFQKQNCLSRIDKLFEKAFNFSLKNAVINSIMIKASLISYEIVWATLRIPPIIAYLLFEDHPKINIG